MSKRLVVYFGLALALAVATATAASKPVTGAKVTNVEFVDGTATITIQNLSKHDVSGYSLGITAKTADGLERYSERTEDYGPADFTHKGLHPGESTKEMIPFPAEVQSVQAEIIVAIYDNQTAEVKNDRTFQDTLSTRKSIATALQESATVFKNAVADPNPRERAKHDFEELMRNADTNKANAEYLNSHANVAASAPAGQEREFMQEHADRLKQEADLFARHAQIRRLP